MSKFGLIWWALRHDLNPKYLYRRMLTILVNYSRIWYLTLVYLIVSSGKLLLLPLEPFRVAIMAVYHSIVHTKNVSLLRKNVERYNARPQSKD